jgi:hypothetical protein
MALAVTCTNEEKIKVTAAPVTAEGNPAQIDGALTIEVQSGDGTFTQDPAEPLAFFAVSGTALGDTVYKVSGDADLGSGVVTIEDLVTLTVMGAQAKSFGLTAGAPEAK